MESCYITGIFNFRYVYFIWRLMHLSLHVFPTEREGEGGDTHGEWDDFKKKMLSYYPCLRKYMVCVFVSLSKIPCTCHQIGYLENTDEVPNFLPQGLCTLSNSWGLGFVCSLISLVLMPFPPSPTHPTHTLGENTHMLIINNPVTCVYYLNQGIASKQAAM